MAMSTEVKTESRLPSEKKIILVDQDSTIVDLDGRMVEILTERKMDHLIPLVIGRPCFEFGVSFHITETGERLTKSSEAHTTLSVKLSEEPLVTNKEAETVLRGIMNESGFFLSIKPINGAIEALKEMKKEGHTVFIVTSPLSNNDHCVPEKYKWVENHLGKEWTRNLIITKDKTVVSGDYLIDDKPSVIGVSKPSWEHIYFDHSYNRPYIEGGEGDKTKRRLWNWGTSTRGTWKMILDNKKTEAEEVEEVKQMIKDSVDKGKALEPSKATRGPSDLSK